MADFEKLCKRLQKQNETIARYEKRDAEVRQQLAAVEAQLQEERRRADAAAEENNKIRSQIELLQLQLEDTIKHRDVQAAAAAAANQGKAAADALLDKAYRALQAQEGISRKAQASQQQLQDALTNFCSRLGYVVQPAQDTVQEPSARVTAASRPPPNAAHPQSLSRTGQEGDVGAPGQSVPAAQLPQPLQLQPPAGGVRQVNGVGGRDPRLVRPPTSQRSVLQDQNSAPAPPVGATNGRATAGLPTAKGRNEPLQHHQQQQQPQQQQAAQQPQQQTAASLSAPQLTTRDPAADAEPPLPKLICEKKAATPLHRSHSGGGSLDTARSAPLQEQRAASGGRHGGGGGAARRSEYPLASLEDPVVWLNRNIFSYVQALRKEKHFEVFKDPVPRSVVGYHDTIKKPMDLGTILEWAENQECGSPEEFKGHMGLVVRNAKEFNPKGHPVHSLADQLWDWINKTNSFFNRVDDEWLERKKAFDGYAYV